MKTALSINIAIGPAKKVINILKRLQKQGFSWTQLKFTSYLIGNFCLKISPATEANEIRILNCPYLLLNCNRLVQYFLN